MTSPLILKRAPIGSNLEDYSVLEDGVVVGRIFLSPESQVPRVIENNRQNRLA